MGSGNNSKPTVSRKDRMKLTEQLTPQDAVDMLQKAETDRLTSCRKEVDIALAKYNCMLASDILICGSNVTSRVLVLPRKGG